MLSYYYIMNKSIDWEILEEKSEFSNNIKELLQQNKIILNELKEIKELLNENNIKKKKDAENQIDNDNDNDNDNEIDTVIPINPNINILDQNSLNRLSNHMWRRTPYTTTPNIFSNILTNHFKN